MKSTKPNATLTWARPLNSLPLAKAKQTTFVFKIKTRPLKILSAKHVHGSVNKCISGVFTSDLNPHKEATEFPSRRADEDNSSDIGLLETV